MRIAVVDIETTGFFRDKGHIVEVGIAVLDTDSGEVTPMLDYVCREAGLRERDQKAWIFSNSDLTVEEVRHAPDFSEIMGEIQEVFDLCDCVTAYNKAFDFEFLRDRGVHIDKEAECPMRVSTPLCKLEGMYGDYKWPSCEECWQHLFPDVEYVEAHRALDDAIHESHIVYELWKLGKITCP